VRDLALKPSRQWSLGPIVWRRPGHGAIVVFALFAVLYMALPSNTIGVLHDSAGLLLSLDGSDILLHPNHLLFQPVLGALTGPFAIDGDPASRIDAYRVIAAAAGAGALALGYLILTARFAAPPTIAGLAAACSGLSFGPWFYSISVEIYVFPLLLSTAAAFVLLTPKPTAGRVLLAAALHSGAVLMHQSAILLAPMALLILLVRHPGPRRARLTRLALYGTTGAVLVGGAYGLAMAAGAGVASAADARRWMLGYASSGEFWQSDIRIAALAPAVGWARAVIGGHFALGLAPVAEVVDRLTTHSDITDDRYMVRRLAPALLWTLAATTLAWAALAAVVAGRALAAGLRHRPGDLLVLVAWLAPFAVFFSIYDSHNRDFWITQTFVAWLAVGLGAAAVPARRAAAAALAALALGLAAINGVGSVLPAHAAGNDYYREKATRLTADLGPHDTLVLADGWPWRHHVDLVADVAVVELDDFRGPGGPARLAGVLSERARAGRIRLWPEVTGLLDAGRGTAPASLVPLLAVLERPGCRRRTAAVFDGPGSAALTCAAWDTAALGPPR